MVNAFIWHSTVMGVNNKSKHFPFHRHNGNGNLKVASNYVVGRGHKLEQRVVGSSASEAAGSHAWKNMHQIVEVLANEATEATGGDDDCSSSWLVTIPIWQRVLVMVLLMSNLEDHERNLCYTDGTLWTTEHNRWSRWKANNEWLCAVC